MSIIDAICCVAPGWNPGGLQVQSRPGVGLFFDLKI